MGMTFSIGMLIEVELATAEQLQQTTCNSVYFPRIAPTTPGRQREGCSVPKNNGGNLRYDRGGLLFLGQRIDELPMKYQISTSQFRTLTRTERNVVEGYLLPLECKLCI